MHKHSLISSVAVLALAMLSACGGSDTQSPAPTPSPSSSPSPTPAPSPAWELLWEDNFDESINPANWSYEVNCFGGGNNEHQCYTNRSDNAYIEDGVLHIVAKEETHNGPALQDDNPDYDAADTSQTRNYTSARLRSKDLFEFKYGRVEISAQLPGGQGSWPALWMLPTDFVYGGWPASGEIDIMEAVNLDTAAANEVHGTLHYGMSWPQWSTHGAAYSTEDDFTGEFHTYAIEWEADEIRWYVDGVHFQTQNSANWYNHIWQDQSTGFDAANPQAPYDQEFHLLMNLAVGGDWPGTPDTGWTEDRKMLVDYVRVYQCSAGNADGSGCASDVNAEIEVNADAAGPQENNFNLFTDGAETLSVGETEIPLIANVWEAEAGNVSSSTLDIGGEHANVWALDFSGLGNAFLTVGEVEDDFENALALEGGSGWTRYGVLSFDLYIDSVDAETGLLVKMDSGYPNLGQLAIDLPETGVWTSVKIKISDLLDNPHSEGSGLAINTVANTFVIETSGTHTISLQLDNIQLSCTVNPTAQSWQSDRECGLATVTNSVVDVPLDVDVLDIFSEAISYWEIGICCGGVDASVIADPVEAETHGNVVQFSYSQSETLSFFQSAAPLDLTEWVGGTVEFDMYIEAEPVDAAWMMKVDCVYPCGTGDVALTTNLDSVVPTVGIWQHYRFSIDTLVGLGLDLSSVNTPLVIFPAWANQTGAIFRVDKVQFIREDD